MLDRWDDGYATRAKWSKAAKCDGKYIKLLRASHLLRIHPHVVHRLVSEGKLTAIVRKTDRTKLFLVEARSVEKLRGERARYVSLEDASKLLGISQLNILSLVDKSLLAGAEEPSADNHNTWRFDKVALQSFLKNILSKTVGLRPCVRNEIQSFKTVLIALTRDFSRSGGEINTLIEDILNGLLIPMHKSPHSAGVSGLSFHRKEVKAYLTMKLARQRAESFRVIGLVKELGLEPEFAYFLARKGLIKTTSRRHGNQRCRIITRKAIFKFKSQFIFAKDAAQEIGTSTKFLVNGLQTLGITPVSGRAVDLGPVFIFRRADIEQLNLSEVIRLLPRKILKQSRVITSAEAAKILSVPEETMIALIRNGVVKPHHKSSDSETYLFYRRTIERYKRQFANLDELISTKAAARLLQLKRTTLFHVWIRLGYLNFEVSSDGNQRLLRKSEVNQLASFLKEAVNIKEAAQLLSVSTEYIRRWTWRKWLTPLPNPYPRAFRSHVYSRAALANLRVNHQPIGIHKKTLLPVSTKIEPRPYLHFQRQIK